MKNNQHKIALIERDKAIDKVMAPLHKELCRDVAAARDELNRDVKAIGVIDGYLSLLIIPAILGACVASLVVMVVQ